ncbi:MAG: ABC-ATPase domain-containing protein [Gemmatimonadetes bacterium]|nr:ABC-ATPase domain-containing protein [Gemmatimonadota bacterium]
MTDLDRLASTLQRLDGQSYPAYKRATGAYDAGDFVLHIDHVQGDPFADPSRLRAAVPAATAALPEWALATPTRRRATADFLNRRLAEALTAASHGGGSGKSGQLTVLRPGQQVLARASMAVREDGSVTARFRAGFPAEGRRILGNAAAELLTQAVPGAVRRALLFQALSADDLRTHVETVEDSVALRAQLEDRGLVAFVADGASLPRRSGVDDRPLERGIVAFESPDSLRVELSTPNAGPLRGLGVPSGVTLIVGGGYHGKSTLLRAIERGVYDHVPGDGRERVVALPESVKVRAEDGRRVTGTDISNFITGLPAGGDTTCFHTVNASGSTSQAAAIVEALEVGARCLLLDEDTSATNFMIRDARMQALIADDQEPITPFIDRARQLHDDLGVSTILVVGGSGDYFDVADTVVAMRGYRPGDATAAAAEVARRLPTRRAAEGGSWRPIRRRAIEPASIDPSRGRRAVSIRVRSIDRVEFGTELVNLGGVEQLVEEAQTRAIAYAVARAADRARTAAVGLTDALEAVREEIEREGLHIVHPHFIGELSAFRAFELAAFVNRLRGVRGAGEVG